MKYLLPQVIQFIIFLSLLNTGEVFNIPREAIVNQSEFNLSERRERNMINWMTCGSKYKVAIRPTNDNWKTLMDNYLVCKL